MANLFRERAGHLLIGHQVASRDLNVERRRYSEVDCLRSDVCGQEIEASAWEFLMKTKPKLSYVIRRRPMILLQRNRNVSISRSRQTTVAESEVNARNGKPMLSTIP